MIACKYRGHRSSCESRPGQTDETDYITSSANVGGKNMTMIQHSLLFGHYDIGNKNPEHVVYRFPVDVPCAISL